MNISDEAVLNETRRQFFAQRRKRDSGRSRSGHCYWRKRWEPSTKPAFGGLPGLPHFAPKAKRAIYLHMLGAPPQMETFDYKPGMKDWFDKDLPETIRQGQRLTTMTSGQTRFPDRSFGFPVRTAWQERQRGFPSCCPIRPEMVDDIAIIRTMHTEAINHEPAITYLQTGLHDCGQALHRLLDGLRVRQHGSRSADLRRLERQRIRIPKANVQAISARLWSSGFLSGQY